MAENLIRFPLERHVGVDRIAKQIATKAQDDEGIAQLVAKRVGTFENRALACGLAPDVAHDQAAHLLAALIGRVYDHIDSEAG
jgi:hypothetical protein